MNGFLGNKTINLAGTWEQKVRESWSFGWFKTAWVSCDFECIDFEWNYIEILMIGSEQMSHDLFN